MEIESLRQRFAERAANLREYFNEPSSRKLSLNSFLEDAAKELDAKQIALDAMFSRFDEQGFGAIYANSLGQYGFVLADASEQGAFRYQLFDKRGFFAHSTYPTVDQAIYELCDSGFKNLAPDNTLENLSSTSQWKLSTEGLALRTRVESGSLSWAEAERLYADLKLKYAPDLVA